MESEKTISHLTRVNSSSNSSKTIVPRKIIEGLNLRTSVKQPKMGDVVIATYKLSYKKGMVIALGIYSDDIITNVNLTNTLEICYSYVSCIWLYQLQTNFGSSLNAWADACFIGSYFCHKPSVPLKVLIPLSCDIPAPVTRSGKIMRRLLLLLLLKRDNDLILTY